MLGKIPASLKGKIKPEMFEMAIYRDAFEIVDGQDDCLATIDAGGLVIELDKLRKHGPSQAIFNVIALSMESVASVTAVDYWVEQLIEAWTRRRWVALAKTAMDDDKSLQAITTEASAIISQTASLTGDDVMVRVVGDGELPPEHTGLASSMESLNKSQTVGGFAKAQTSAVCAYTKGGKTAFLTQQALTLSHQGRGVYVTLADLDANGIEQRIMKQITGWSRPPDSLELNRDWYEKRRWLRDQRITVYEGLKTRSGRDIDRLVTWLEDHKPEWIVLDYVQRLTSVKYQANPVQQAEYCSSELCGLASRLNCPIVYGSQITEGGKERKDVTKGSRCWEEDAGLVIRLKVEDGIGTATVAYSRFGPSGIDLGATWDAKSVRWLG